MCGICNNADKVIKATMKKLSSKVTFHTTLNTVGFSTFNCRSLKYWFDFKDKQHSVFLTHSWWRSLFYRNQTIDFQSKPRDWFLCDRSHRHETVDYLLSVYNELWLLSKPICNSQAFNFDSELKIFVALQHFSTKNV